MALRRLMAIMIWVQLRRKVLRARGDQRILAVRTIGEAAMQINKAQNADALLGYNKSVSRACQSGQMMMAYEKMN